MAETHSKKGKVEIPISNPGESVTNFTVTRLDDRYPGESRNESVTEILSVPVGSIPRLMPYREWDKDSNSAALLQEPGFKEKLDGLEQEYVKSRLQFENLKRQKEAARSRYPEHVDHLTPIDFAHRKKPAKALATARNMQIDEGWPLSKPPLPGDKEEYLLLDTTEVQKANPQRGTQEKRARISSGTYKNWLVESISFYKRKTALLLNADSAETKKLEEDFRAFERENGIDPDAANYADQSSFDDRIAGKKTLEVGLYGKRAKEARGYDPRGFRLDMHHIPYSVTVDVSAQIEAKIKKKIEHGMDKAKAREEAQKEARGEARAAGPAIALPWDFHRKLHESTDPQVLQSTDRKEGVRVVVHETAEGQRELNAQWLNENLTWIGYSKTEIDRAMEALKEPIKKYKERYPDPAPSRTIVDNAGIEDRIGGHDGHSGPGVTRPGGS